MSVTPLPIGKNGRTRKPTSTANFGSGKRESHDATDFYKRFVKPEVSADETVEMPTAVDVIYTGDARDMAAIASNSVALVVTSPPYFAGKQYEESLGENGVPADYLEYLTLLRDVFDECKRVLEPGGRIAVNVANLGRRPYRSLSGDVTDILGDLGLLLRGEVIWWKGRAAGGSCAWGSFQRPANPVLRDVTERIVIAGKGRFDRALPPLKRHTLGLPSTTTISRDEFLEATTDLWEIAPESATRVGHPAPFPAVLPQRLIELFTYRDDLVLDPFMGSGSTAVAAVRTGRHYVGFDTDPAYVEGAQRRIDDEHARMAAAESGPATVHRVTITAGPAVVAVPDDDAPDDALPDVAVPDDARVTDGAVGIAVRDGRKAGDLAAILLESCGFTEIQPDFKPRGLGIVVSFTALDQTGATWAFDLSGAFTTNRGGLRRADIRWKALGKAAVLRAGRPDLPLVLLTTDTPVKSTVAFQSLAAVCGPGLPVLDVVELLDDEGVQRLRAYATRGRPTP